jgi:quercetin dioxygenase-like cupin family protein
MTTLRGFGSLTAIPEEKITDKITRRVLAGENGMMVWWNIKAGTHAAAHSHPHEQIMCKGKWNSALALSAASSILANSP